MLRRNVKAYDAKTGQISRPRSDSEIAW